MSYDVSIRLPVKGLEDKYIVACWLSNITWNVRELIKQSSGWEIKNEDNNGPILPWMEQIRHGIAELEKRPGKYRKYEAPNGWGTISGTLRFYKDCMENAEGWLSENEDLLPAAVIWVS